MSVCHNATLSHHDQVITSFFGSTAVVAVAAVAAVPQAKCPTGCPIRKVFMKLERFPAGNVKQIPAGNVKKIPAGNF